MIDLSELNYKQLIDLEKEIQKEKEKKIHSHVTKGDLTCSNSAEMEPIYDMLDKRFRDIKYGWPQKVRVDKFDWSSDEEKEQARLENFPAPCVESIYSRITSSFLYLCDIAFENYHDYLGRTDNTSFNKGNHYGSCMGPDDSRRYFTVAIDKEIPWQKAEKYKAMYEDLAKIFKIYAKGETK